MVLGKFLPLPQLVALVGVTGCTILLGENKPFHEVGATGGGASTSATTSMSATGSSAGVTSSSGTSSGSAAGTTSSTGTGGSSTKTCHVLHDAADCGAGSRCTITDAQTGALGCVPIAAAPLGEYAGCSNDANCPAGTWCDRRTLVCAPFCASAAGCGNGHCVGASDGTNTIPGISVCTAHCDPETASPCGAGATCAYAEPVLDFDCFSSGEVPVTGACQSSGDCAKGLVCGVSGTTGTGSCLSWCHPAGSSGDCAAVEFCNEFSPAFSYDGVDYGYCN
jgi:hypothetical protein